MKVLVIIPAYNEQESIVAAVSSVVGTGYDYLVVNDGSRDATLDICRSSGFNVLNLSENLGIGGAVQAGYKYALEAGYDVAVQFDGDGQHDAACIEQLVDGIVDGGDLVIGSRFLGGDNQFKSTFMRRVGIQWLSRVIRLFGGRVADPTSGFRACSRKALQLFCREYPIDYPEPESIVVAIGAGLSVEERPVVMHERQGGASSIGASSSAYYMIKVTLAIAIMGVFGYFSKEKQ
ncbi:glycosyltransferase family 2 protein [Paraeggerthella hongkongensis]|uniref:glycosyltransferase family 2 protein n=1 Tax=Paraeggerthella hominis TaxID=2897351 RepID=UPI001C0FF069|nr:MULTISPECIES: glycosyltransferase family 2 protein [Paraeggerthella]MBU5406202.1 glycosyltransferase family 2 protein [Paraeggerthella hongkongensis]MCD2434051.1 glycosyltransferase family 2 protein [Paraeggerthella hominis]